MEAFGFFDTCHHLDEGKILTITDALCFPLIRVYKRKVGEAKILGCIMNALKFIIMLVAEECDESFCIAVDLSKLIVGCTGGSQLSHRVAGRLYPASLRILTSL